jgi:hypothetical protein
MARATRSGDSGIKKRKRNSSPHEKPNKQLRTDQLGGVAESVLEEEDGRKILDVLEEWVTIYQSGLKVTELSCA